MTNRASEAGWLQALGHPSRVEILHRFLAIGTLTPSEVADALTLPLGTASYHVRALTKAGVLRLAGRTKRRGASVHHYQLADRERTASVLWGLRANLLVTDFERESGKGDATATLDAEALDELHTLTADYLARIGELGLQSRERQCENGQRPPAPLTRIAVMLAIDHAERQAS